ncbi:MAG: class B sortase [Candidatus Scatovivens sp.]
MAKAKHYNKKKTNIPSIILLCIFIILLFFSGTKIVIWYMNNQNNKKISDEIAEFVTVDETKEDEKYAVDFEKLKEKNSDIVAWLKVNGTNIETTVVKTTDNDYYLTHNFNKEYNSAGWIFADYKNKVDGTDKNLVIYGHNMRDDSMFGSLKWVINEDWYNNEDNKYITLITENETQVYEVFSVYQIEKEDYYIQTSFDTEIEFNTFAQTIKKRSKKDFNVDVNKEDAVLTLSTCANNNKYRVVLHAKKI